MGDMVERTCEHLHQIQVYETAKEVCDQCVEHDDVWPALRMCLICGFVGCCDTSKHKHMKQHYEQTGHPIFRSIRLDEGWGWCYEHNAFFYGRTLEKHYPHPACPLARIQKPAPSSQERRLIELVTGPSPYQVTFTTFEQVLLPASQTW